MTDNRAIFGTVHKGKINTTDLEDAETYAAAKRAEGYRVRVHDRGLTQGHRIYPITVSWWLG